MKKRTLTSLLLATAVTGSLGVMTGCAIAHDRPPTETERTAIVKVLEENGYTSFGEIEMEGSKIEVEDALHTDGKRYELKLDAKTLKILAREEED